MWTTEAIAASNARFGLHVAVRCRAIVIKKTADPLQDAGLFYRSTAPVSGSAKQQTQGIDQVTQAEGEGDSDDGSQR